ncbi:putative envelope-like protein, partial [Trifolium pratense]
MSQSSGSAQIKNKAADAVKTRSKSKKEEATVVIDATLISSILATVSKKKKSTKSTAKVSESSPSVSIKSGKSKKKKPQSPVKKGLNMSDLYLSKNPFETANVESHDAASGKTANVESSGKATKESSKSESEKVDKETPSEHDNPISGETLGKSKTIAEKFVEVSKLSVSENVAIPTDATADVADKSKEKTDCNPDAPKDVEPPTVLSDAAKDVEASKEGTPENVANSEPENEAVENSEKTTNEEQTMVDLDEVPSEEDLQPPPTQKGIGRRLRSRTTTPAPAAVTTPVVTKKTKDTALKPVKFGPKKGWSKLVPPPEKKKSVLKRKSAPSSDSDFEAERDDSSIKPPTKKAMSAKKAMPQAAIPVMEDFPCDNVSFHLPSYAQRWGIICKRRLALERELGKDILECEEVVNL